MRAQDDVHLVASGWLPDYPDPLGMLGPILDGRSIHDGAGNTDLSYFIAAIAITLAAIPPMAWRWQQLLRARGLEERVPWGHPLQVVLVGGSSIGRDTWVPVGQITCHESRA